MDRIEVKLSLPVVAPLLDVVKDLAEGLRTNLAAPPDFGVLEADFHEPWMQELLEGQREDLETLLALFDDEFFSEGIVGFDPGNAEAVLRACTSVRLRLRAGPLMAIEDEQLESGAVDPNKLGEALKKAFYCYLFLATLQELIIQHLEPGIVG